MSEQIPVSEIFVAPQGEGSLLGLPMVFIRVQGCNFDCSWCDTAYAIPMLGLEASGREIDDIVDAVVGVTPPSSRWVSITGGEPTVHRHFATLVHRLLDRGRQVLVETNASQSLRRFPSIVESVFWSTSPKMASSGMSHHPTPMIDDLVRFGPDVQWQAKFVIDTEPDLDEALIYCADRRVPKSKIWLQPCTHEGQTISEYAAKLRWLTELATPLGLAITVQQHSIAYGREARGV